MKSDNKLMPVSVTRTLRMKVRSEAYAWLNSAAIEVNQVFNYCNETSLKAATRTDLKRKWMSGFDLCKLTAGATKYFDKIGADSIQSICTHYAQKRVAAHRLKLHWRVSGGARRSLGVDTLQSSQPQAQRRVPALRRKELPGIRARASRRG